MELEFNKRKSFYKSTIPNDWEDLTIGDSVKFSGGSQPPQKVFVFEEKEGYIRLIQTRDYRTDDYKTFIPTHLAKKFCEENDIMIGRYGPPVFQVFRGLKGAYNVALIKAIPTNNIDTDYCYYFLNRSELRMYIESLSQRSGGQTGVDINKLNEYPFPLPPLPEQKVIANVLSLMDNVINTNNQLKEQKELRKKWLMQNLLSGGKRVRHHVKTEQYRKTKLGQFPSDWELLLLNDILTIGGTTLTPKKNELYEQIGIRSHTKGIFYKDKVTGVELGNKRVFWIEPACFIVNIVFAWEHAIAKTTENEIGMIASHRFPMYRPKKDILDLDYLLYFFKSARGKYLLGLASPGGAGRNKTLGKSEFMKLKIPVPPISEQKSIARILTLLDNEIEILKTKSEKLKEQKKGMMQQLLTGKKRLKLDKK